MTLTTQHPTPADETLREAASALLLRVHEDSQHRVAAAVRTASGEVHLGLHLGSDRVSVCAEMSAIANARIAGDHEIEAITAVGMGPDGAPRVINPCGVCRELVPHFAPDAHVIIDAEGVIVAVPVAQLLPLPWVRARSYD